MSTPARPKCSDALVTKGGFILFVSKTSLGGVSNWWGEVSGKPAYAMLRRGASAVEDEGRVMQLLDGDEIIWHGEHPDPNAPPVFKAVKGWYTKSFGNKKSTKIILGSPAL